MDFEDEENTSRANTSWRHSFQGIFRAGSTSPDRTMTGTVHMATVAVLRPALPPSEASKASFVTANSGTLMTARLVKVADFADSDSSNDSIYTDEEARSAESIYSIIQQYEDTTNFLFDEDFNLSSDSGQETSGFFNQSAVSTPKSPFSDGNTISKSVRPKRSIPKLPSGSSLDAPTIPLPVLEPSTSDQERHVFHIARNAEGIPIVPVRDPSGADSAAYPEPNVTPIVVSEATRISDPRELLQNSSNYEASTSMSSGELLTQLDVDVLPGQPVLPTSNSMSGLTAGLDSQSELPVMIYTVQNSNSRNDRWSVYEQQRRKIIASQSMAPSVPTPVYPGIRSGSNSARSVSVLSEKIDLAGTNSEHSGASPRFTGGSSMPLHSNSGSSNSGSTEDENQPKTHTSSSSNPGSLLAQGVASTLVRNSKAFRSVTLVSPVQSVVQDTTTKQFYHDDMHSNEKLWEHSVPLYSHKSTKHGANDMPWSKWMAMMAMGLVAVPIYFMLSFGVFDYGGLYQYSLERALPPDEKSWDIQIRYFRRYTRIQKVLSFVFGVFWLLVVLAMVGVGLGLAITREH